MTDAGDFDLSKRAAHDLATAAVTLAMKMVYEEDAELAALRYERDQYKARLEKHVDISPMIEFTGAVILPSKLDA